MNEIRYTTSSNIEPWKGLTYIVVGLIFIGWLFNTPSGLLGKAEAVGYAVCHRIEAHSFLIGDRAMPMCARCSGMYLAAVLGITYMALFNRRRAGSPSKKILFILGILVLFFIFDGINSFLFVVPFLPYLYEPSNDLRLLSGSGMGIVMATVLFPAFNQTIWKNWNRRPVFDGIGYFAIMLSSVLIVDLCILLNIQWLLYGLSLVSAAGVLLLLTMIYTMVWAMVLKLENKFMFFRQLIFLLCAGFGLAITQIVVLDIIRFFLTGTWNGFHL